MNYYAMLLQILLEAEARVAEFPNDGGGVRTRSQETVDLCNQRLEREGMSRADLVKLVRQLKRAARPRERIKRQRTSTP